jgi:hypothetical protein
VQVYRCAIKRTPFTRIELSPEHYFRTQGGRPAERFSSHRPIAEIGQKLRLVLFRPDGRTQVQNELMSIGGSQLSYLAT